mmetsp:Transcript_20408/g.26061  ORF Transcript_20408/g.26061 Transcript_20408/m.26061 type:complete len:117 (+) Transcript_20408:112-462(+)
MEQKKKDETMSNHINNNDSEKGDAQKWSNAADEIIRKDFLKEARDKCKEKVEIFVECARENNLLVIFKCRQQNREMNDCVGQYTSEAKWNEYRKKKVRDFEAKGSIQPTELKYKPL